MAITKLNSQAIPPNTIIESDLSYPLTNFSSTGIDDNATSTAVTIDANEKVGINESSPDELLHVKGPDEVVIKIEATGSQTPTLYDGKPKLKLVPMATNGITGEAIIEAGAPSSFLHASSLIFRAGKSQNQLNGSYAGGSFSFHDGNTQVCSISDQGIEAANFKATSGGTTALSLSSTGRVTTGENLEVAGDCTVSGGLTVDSEVVLGGGGTIAGATWANGLFHLGSASSGWAMDYNELYNASDAIIGTISGNLDLNPAGNITTAHKIISTNNAEFGDSTDITMNSSGAGQLHINGNAYSGAIAMDASSMYLYHNSSSRNLVLGTNETARVTIAGNGGNVTFAPIIIGKTNTATTFNSANDTGSMSVRGDLTNPAVISFHRTSAYAVNFGLDGSNMKLGGWSAVSTKFIWEMANGNFHADGNIIAYSTSASDERFKDDVQPITGALDTVDALKGVTFTWNAGSREGKRDYGLIAQEVEKVLPELVHESALPMMTGDEETQYKTLDYEKLCAVLISAVSELRAEVDALKAAQ